jgi:hypothetical protein
MPDHLQLGSPAVSKQAQHLLEHLGGVIHGRGFILCSLSAQLCGLCAVVLRKVNLCEGLYKQFVKYSLEMKVARANC